MIDEDKTREQLIAELAQLRKRVTNAEAGMPDADAAVTDMVRIVHRSPTVTFVWRGCDGWPVSFVSESVRRYGHIPQDLIGLVHHERYIASQDLPAFIATFVEAGGSPSSRSFMREYRLLTRSGETRWVRERLWVERDDRGTITHFTGLLTDVEDLRQLEAVVHEQKQRLSALFEGATQPILLHDPSGRCIDVNLAACDLLGYTRDELLHIPFDALVSADTAARAQRLARAGAGARDVAFEGEFIGRDGSRLPAVLESHAVELKGDRAILTLMQSQVLGVSVRAAPPREPGEIEALRRQIEEMEQTNRHLQEERDAASAGRSRYEEQLRKTEVLLRDVHHRVKNNLQVVASLLGLQAEYVQDQRALDAFAESQNRVRAMALVHERMYQSSDLARIDLGAYVRDLAERMFTALGADPGIALDVDVESISLPMDTVIPCGLLVSELISNSIKHAFPQGRGGSVGVTLHRQDDRIALTVADDGVGFPQGVDYRHTETLGLQLVGILAEQLGATIDLSSSDGTRFSITFRDEG